MKKIKKMPLVILTLIVLVLIASISIFIFNARETKSKDSVLLEEKKADVVKDKQTDEKSNDKVDEIELVDKTKEESKKEESTSNTTSTSTNSKKESTTSNQKSTQSSNNSNTTNNSKKQEESVANQPQSQSQTQTNNTQTNNSQSSNNVTTDPYNYITGGVIDSPTKEACLAKGDAILNRHLDELMDYNSMHIDNQKSQDITNLECYPVHKPDQDGWFLNILCNSGNCNSKYK